MDKHDKRLVAIWAILVALTLVSFESSWGLARLHDPAVAVILVIAAALVKVRFVVMEFMEVRLAPWALRGPLEIWIVGVSVAILALWFGAGA